MTDPAKVVSIHPYFRVKPGHLEKAKALMKEFVEKTQLESENLYYDFTVKGDIVFCREGYVGAEGLLKHLENIKATLQEMLKISDVLRLELHGAAAELDKLRGPFADMQPEWFVFQTGVKR